MHISYWAPYFDKIATVKSVQNSIKSILLYYKKPCKVDLLNFFGEWSNNKIEVFNTNETKLNYVSYYKYKIVNFLPKNSFIKSRISYIALFILGIYPLIDYLKIKKPNYLVIHLISSLPLLILLFFNFETKFILRVSGLPKLNIVRKLIWKISNKKIYKVFVPTKATFETLKKNEIFDESKLFIVKDPVFEIKKLKFIPKKNDVPFENFFLSIGRLTKQKNHYLLFHAFRNIMLKNNKYNLLVLGDGELRKKLFLLAKKLGISNNVHLIGNVENVYKYIKKSLCVISTSLWEDPGFVMIESAISRKIIISSDCLMVLRSLLVKTRQVIFLKVIMFLN